MVVTPGGPLEREAGPTPPAVDPLDERAIAGVLANTAHLAKPSVFDEQIAQARAGLAGTDATAYEAGLVTLGLLVGASPSNGDGGNDSAPDAVWIFADMLWVVLEAKSEAKVDGELGSGDARQAGGHIRFVAAEREVAAPGDSPTFLVTPQRRVHSSARRVAEEHVYLVRPDQILDLFDRVVRAWRVARGHDIATLAPTALTAIFAAENALPTRWLPVLRAEPLRSDAALK